jgi:hypothetical protein
LKENNALFCIDQDQEIGIRGMSEIDSVTLNIDLIPCKECTQTISELQNYLTHPEFVIMFNS